MRAILLIFLVATAAVGADPVYEAPDPAPDVYAPLVWSHAGTLAHGWWSTDAAIVREATEKKNLQVQVDYLTDRAAKECTDATQKANRQWLGSTPAWLLAGGAFVLGVVGGVFAAKRL